MSYQSIYNQLRAAGLTEAGALAMLGNWDCESNCQPNRLEGDFTPNKTKSKDYVERAMDGRMSKEEFCHPVGFGLAQWTLPYRKGKLWDFWKSSGKALDSAEMQTRFAINELKTEGEYASLFAKLKNSNDLYELTKLVCLQYERPAYNNIDARFASANRIKGEIDLDGGGNDPDPDPDPDPQPEPEEHRLELRTIDKRCSGFPEVYLLQSVLLCRNYIETEPTDTFGSWLEEIVKKFQEDHGLIADGIVGPLSWAKLLERG